MFYWLYKLVYKAIWKKVKAQDIAFKKNEIMPEDIDIFSSFFNCENKDLEFNIYYHLKKETRPLIIDIHGGGWAYGNKDSNASFCSYLAKNGFNVISFSYTLAFKAKLIDMIKEIDELINHLYKNKGEYNLDFNNLFLTGDSAGGELIFLYSAILYNQKLKDIYKVNSSFNISGICLNHATPYIKDLGEIKNHKILSKIAYSGVKKMLLGKKSKSKIYNFVEPNEVLTSAFPSLMLITSLGDYKYRFQTTRLIADLDKLNIKYELNDLNDIDAPHIYNVFDPTNKKAIKTNEELVKFFKTNLNKF